MIAFIDEGGKLPGQGRRAAVWKATMPLSLPALMKVVVDDWGLLVFLVGFSRGSSLAIYTCPERVLVPATAEVATG